MNKANNHNADIRKAIIDKGMRHYQVADAMKISTYTFTHWLQRELPPDKKKRILEAIKNYEV